MRPTTVHLGFELGTGTPVEIPIAHMVVSGMTQQAGKTTALEALINRSGLRAVTFVTKRGESAFAGGRRIPPFFRERADWVFVSSLIDATMGEKNKLLRSWLMKVCRTTRTLAEVQQNVQDAKRSARGFSESIYTEIEGYLELVVPQIAQLPPARAIAIGPGLNVMDLAPYSTELQALVIRSVLEHVYEHEREVVTVIPEAWEFLPEGRGGPAKREAEVLIRKGASLRNFVWIDSQDLAGVWKTVVRAAAVCLVGVQREANEIKRTLANIPAGIAKPKAADVATLEIGQFYACWGRHAVKTYVQPAWMDAGMATNVAVGTVTTDQVMRQQQSIARESAAVARRFLGRSTQVEEDQVNATEAQQLRDENARLDADNARLTNIINDLQRRLGELEGREADRPAPRSVVADRREPAPAGRAAGVRAAGAPEASPGARAWTAGESLDNERLYQAIKARLIEEAPGVLKVLTIRPELEVTVQRRVVEMDGTSLKGRVARLIHGGFFSDPRTQSAARAELKRTGPDVNTGNLSRSFSEFVRDGFLTDEGASGYQAVAGMKVNIVQANP